MPRATSSGLRGACARRGTWRSTRSSAARSGSPSRARASEPRTTVLLFAEAAHGLLKLGALVVSDRRVLWSSKPGKVVAVDRADVVAVTLIEAGGGGRVELRLTGGRRERFDVIAPEGRAAAVAAALDPGR